MQAPPDPARWHGRSDPDDGPRAMRWHQRVLPWHPGAAPGVALAGFACDAGVARNQGRTGAFEGPAALRAALGNLAWHRRGPAWDAGDVVCAGDALEEAQAELGARVAGLLDQGQLPVLLGGGHEIAYGSFLGLAAHLAGQARPPSIGVVNVDAHLDLRAGARSTSGTPFRQIAEGCAARGLVLRYLCLGVDEDANTAALLDFAARLGASWVADRDLQGGDLAAARAPLSGLLASVDCVHLSVDLDALPSADAPGVSAPASRGVPLWVIETLVRQVVESGKLAVADVAELCPRLDADGRTARVAARLVARIAGDGGAAPGGRERRTAATPSTRAGDPPPSGHAKGDPP
ncbi:MAG TPA: formimidoylglutamase [Anaeromyxobacter sp.]|nr:formimidoylglutamase [Anaeromyxobacter sp.]